MITNGYKYRIVQKQDGLFYGEMFSTYLNEWVRMPKGYKTKGAVKRYVIPSEYKIRQKRYRQNIIVIVQMIKTL